MTSDAPAANAELTVIEGEVAPVGRSVASRAEALRRWAANVPGSLAVAVRRRASELELIAAACGPLRVAA
ncbi:MAG: hypothetical protein GEV08_04755 [Acidimicrobiia bacterium]|nr:hypothetical protein [Acidimicrobiia bacterium]